MDAAKSVTDTFDLAAYMRSSDWDGALPPRGGGSTPR